MMTPDPIYWLLTTKSGQYLGRYLAPSLDAALDMLAQDQGHADESARWEAHGPWRGRAFRMTPDLRHEEITT